MNARPRFLLFQARKPGDVMAAHEVEVFARALQVPTSNVTPFDLFRDRLDVSTRDNADVFLFGGSGDFSVAGSADWMPDIMALVRRVYEADKPTFASCWGFQAMARALGGRVIHDAERAEIGTYEVHSNEDGQSDPVFSYLGASFLAQMGHEDHVVELPTGTTLLASTSGNENQAYRFDGAPIYCTQFHPELSGDDLRTRFATYPHYLEELPNVSMESFEASLRPTPACSALLTRFLEVHLD